MLPDMPYAGITVPACLKIVVFRFLVAITYEKQRNYVKLRICLAADTQYLWRVPSLALTIPVLVNCKKDKHPSEAKGLSITPAVVEISDGEQLQLEVKTSPENASDRDDILASVVWKSKDESVVIRHGSKWQQYK